MFFNLARAHKLAARFNHKLTYLNAARHQARRNNFQSIGINRTVHCPANQNALCRYITFKTPVSANSDVGCRDQVAFHFAIKVEIIF